MKRYLLFAFDNYYPHGGWHDFNGSFDSLAEAVAAGKACDMDEWHVVDMTTGEIGG